MAVSELSGTEKRLRLMTKNPSRRDQGVAPKKLSVTHSSVGVETTFESSFLRNFGRSAIAVILDRQSSPECLYDLNDLASHVINEQSPYLSSQDAAKRILEKILPSCVNVIGPSQVRGFQSLDILHILNTVLPDLLVCPSDGAPPVLMVEVQSMEFVQAIRRLYFELYLQLITLRSRIPHINTMTGFVVPNKGETHGTVKATVTWKLKFMSFSASLQRLSKAQFSSEVLLAYENQKSLFLLPNDCMHSLPVTIAELETYLNIDNIQGQFYSKFSVICFTQSHVWKLPLIHNSLGRIVPPAQYKQVLYHERIVKKFFVFKKLAGPLELESIKLCCFRDFAVSLYHAIEELHGHGYAHQDIRLPNICFDFKGDDCYVVLIDLDYADFVDHEPLIRGNSLMYTNDISTCAKLDWRQYAMLLCSVRNASSEDDYHTVPPDFTGLGFLKRTFENGDKPLIDEVSQTLENFGFDLKLNCAVWP